MFYEACQVDKFKKVAQFKKNLKTHFFHQAFPECN